MLFPDYATLGCEMAGPHVLRVTLNRPEVMNAINTQMGHDLLDLWTSLTRDAQDVRCIVLTGAGERAFCAGGDLKERHGMSGEQWRLQHELFERQYACLTDLPLPVIAAVNGAAYAGGFEMVLSCDFVYAARNARFALTEVTLGIMPGCGGTQNLPRAIGERRAKEMILTGRPCTAQQAFDWGAVNHLAESEALLEDALETAGIIAANAPLSVRQVKKSIRYGMQMELRTALRFEVEAYNHLIHTADRAEGILAFNEKRKPRFLGK
jgi:enoyl-CoA hydratase